MIHQERRRLLIDATITAIADHGLSKLTLSKIATIAGLTAGSVNFHFDSKDSLLLDTLQFLADELAHTVDEAVDRAGPNPAHQLLALVDASLDSEITEPRKMAVWFAFSSEARARADYQRICGQQEKKIFALTLTLCADIIALGGKNGQMSARAMANGIQGLIDEVWHEILYTGDSYNREDARHLCLSFLASVFPWSFDMPPAPKAQQEPLRTGDKTLSITQATDADAKEIAELFDQYRQFYEQPTDIKLARKFIRDNLRKERSTVIIARDKNGSALGFTQLYPGWCSVAAAPLWTLYDLYVCDQARQRGVGRELMSAALKLAKKNGACRIDLETAIDNHSAQALYEDLGYVRDTHFYKYSLELS